MAATSIKASDVYEVDGTASIKIEGHVYDLKGISEALLKPEDEMVFPQSVCLNAMKYLAGYASKAALKGEELERDVAREETRLKHQAEVVNPLLEGLMPILDIAALAQEFVASADAWVSFTQDKLSLELCISENTELDKEDLADFAEKLNQKGMGLKASENVNGGISWSPSVKRASGTRAAGVAILLDGEHRLKDGKTAEDFSPDFFVHKGRVYIRDANDGFVVMPGVSFLHSVTTETGNPKNPIRPWGHPAKVIAAISTFVGDHTIAIEEFLTWLVAKPAKAAEAAEAAEKA